MSQPLTLANLRQSFVTSLNEDNYFTQLVKLIEEKTKVNREYIAYGKFSIAWEDSIERTSLSMNDN